MKLNNCCNKLDLIDKTKLMKIKMKTKNRYNLKIFWKWWSRWRQNWQKKIHIIWTNKILREIHHKME